MEEEKWERDRANIEKWEVYRDQKIELTAIFIRVLKKKNFLRRWLRLQKAGEIYAKVRENLLLRRWERCLKWMKMVDEGVWHLQILKIRLRRRLTRL